METACGGSLGAFDFEGALHGSGPAGRAIPVGIDGQSFDKVLTGKARDPREVILPTESGDGGFNVHPIRSIRWKRN